jgi:hypothetical protein
MKKQLNQEQIKRFVAQAMTMGYMRAAAASYSMKAAGGGGGAGGQGKGGKKVPGER